MTLKGAPPGRLEKALPDEMEYFSMLLFAPIVVLTSLQVFVPGGRRPFLIRE